MQHSSNGKEIQHSSNEKETQHSSNEKETQHSNGKEINRPKCCNLFQLLLNSHQFQWLQTTSPVDSNEKKGKLISDGIFM